MSAVELIFPLPPEECAARLRAAIDHEGAVSATGLFGTKAVAGRVAGRSVRLRKRNPLPAWNSFQTFLVGTLEPLAGGTRLRGSLGMHPAVRAGVAAGAGLAGVAGGATATVVIGRWLSAGGSFPGWAVIPPLVAAVITTGVGFGRYMARDESAFLVAFLVATLGSPRGSEVIDMQRGNE